MVVATIERIHADRVARPARQAARSCTEGRLGPSTASPGRASADPTCAPFTIDPVTDDIVVARGRPRDRDARAIRRNELDRVDSIWSAVIPLARASGKTGLSSDHKREKDRDESRD